MDEEFDLEAAGDLEGEWDGEWEAGVEPEADWEMETDLEGTLDLETDFEGEVDAEWFRRMMRRVGSFAKRAAPILKRVARVAAPMVGTAVGGPLGGLIGQAATRLLNEYELDYEFESDYEFDTEFEQDYELDSLSELDFETTPASPQEALAELLASVAAQSPTEAEAEAMIGASTLMALSPADRVALQRVLPCLVRGTAILTRVLRRHPLSRPAIRTVPTLVRTTVTTLRQGAGTGRPVTRRTAAQVMARQTRRLLGSKAAVAGALRRNLVGTKKAARTTARAAARPTAARQPSRKRAPSMN